ncbi:Sporulation-specific protein SPO7 [Golovinomyces cichoracearum]|uniref:Sporulation-specific protein SPO7 n=1 Tax=Golovinomyces cichoracearum TaxID=62708 RepID=A0A420IVH1_9PEZI|nr:Sporulation-specific protein SPO7 [Golovinomyces cichoracearum]
MSTLDRIVKGTTPGAELDGVLENFETSSSPESWITQHSSPPKIYLNLLILEASLRAQWLQIRTRRRQHTFFLTLLACWIIYFGYALFLAPRKDGSGVGGSVYWVVEVLQKFCLLCGIVTSVLVWGTGQWERGVRRPRRWVYNTNRGLRGFNCKLVVIKQPWWIEMYSLLSFLFSYNLFTGYNGNIYPYLDSLSSKESDKVQKNVSLIMGTKTDNDVKFNEEDLSPGGDYIRILLLPKPFSAKFREEWDIYRTEYWEKENERRANLRKALHDHARRIAKQQGGLLWWLGFRGWKRSKSKLNERTSNSLRKYGSFERERQRIRSKSLRSNSISRNSSPDLPIIAEADKKGSRKKIRENSSMSKSPGKRRKGIGGKS